MKPEKVTAHPSSEGRRSKLGEILMDNGAITAAQLEHALAEQSTLKLPLGQILLKLDYVTDETMRQALGLQLNVPYLDLENVMIDRGLARVINATFAKRHSLLPVATVGRTLTVAMDDPTATAVVQDLNRLTGFSVTVVTSSSRAIQRAFRRLYDDVPDTATEGARVEGERPPARSQIIGARTESEPLVGHQADIALQELIREALSRGATDVHLDLSNAGVNVRMRLDGVLQKAALGQLQERLNQHAQELATRIRILSDTEAIDRSRPRVGRAQLFVDGGAHTAPIELKISMIQARAGESFAIRLLDRGASARTLEALKLAPALVSKLTSLLGRHSGVLLITGPATPRAAELMHACLQLVPGDAHVVTAEDPVAFVNDRLTQTDVGTTPGATFGGQLRAFVDHDADVIALSDFTGRDTAALGFRAAQSGRLVIAGFAAGNDPVDVVACLRDLGVPGSSVAQSLIGVLHQHGAAAAALWAPDEQDAQLMLQQVSATELRQSARRTTVSNT
jgi:type II secretory ATPase GspE/PulE/Tfp pilus assembly ATPase PilB-like protein